MALPRSEPVVSAPGPSPSGPAEPLPASRRTSAAARVAWTILAASFALWALTFLLVTGHPLWVVLVRHGFEGAFVGGLCDAFAIWRMYAAIEVEYQPLSERVSQFVVGGILRPETLIAEMRDTLDAAETTRALMSFVRDHFPTKRLVVARCLDFWEAHLHALLVKRMVTADLTAWTAQPESVTGLMGRPEVRVVVRKCLAAALDDEARAQRLHQAIGLKWWAKAVIREKRLLDMLRDVVAALDAAPEPGGGEVGKLVFDYVTAYVSAWSALDEAERTAAAEQLVEAIGPPMVTRLAELLWDEREDLIDYLGSGAAVSKHPFVEFVLDRIEPIVRQNPRVIEKLLHDKLQAMGGAGVRHLVESNTRPHLDKIQLNGTLLGAAIGALVGLAAVLMERAAAG